MSNVLIVSGHTDLEHSFANKLILEELQKTLPNATYDFLDALYPDYQIIVPIEQKKILAADLIVLQFPLFWYSVPSLMSRWIEEVFVHGFAFGSTGDKTQGKKLLLSFTSGAPESFYEHGQLQNYRIDEFIVPLKQFANLCSLQWEDYIYTGDLSYASRHDEAKLQEMKTRALAHAAKVIEAIKKA